MRFITTAIVEKEPIARKNLNLLDRDLMLSDDEVNEEFDKSFEITEGDLAAIKPIQLGTKQSRWMAKQLKTHAVQQSTSKMSGIFEDDVKADEISQAAPKKVGVFAPNITSTPNAVKEISSPARTLKILAHSNSIKKEEIQETMYKPIIENISDVSDIENEDQVAGAAEVQVGESEVPESELPEGESEGELDMTFSKHSDIEQERDANMRFFVEMEKFERYRQSFVKSKINKRDELLRKRTKYLKKLKLVDFALKEVNEAIKHSTLQ
jgi:hypothetical protein